MGPTSKPSRCMSSTGSNSTGSPKKSGHVGKEGLVEGDEAVVHVPVVNEVDLSVVQRMM